MQYGVPARETRQHAFEIRETRSWFKVNAMLLAISVFGGDIKEILTAPENLF